MYVHVVRTSFVHRACTMLAKFLRNRKRSARWNCCMHDTHIKIIVYIHVQIHTEDACMRKSKYFRGRLYIVLLYIVVPSIVNIVCRGLPYMLYQLPQPACMHSADLPVYTACIKRTEINTTFLQYIFHAGDWFYRTVYVIGTFQVRSGEKTTTKIKKLPVLHFVEIQTNHAVLITSVTSVYII